MASFLRQVVDPSRPDGYGIWIFPYSTSSNRAPHLVAYGLGSTTEDSKIIFYLNPYSDSTPRYGITVLSRSFYPLTLCYFSPAQKDAPWQKREITAQTFPVAMTCVFFGAVPR